MKTVVIYKSRTGFSRAYAEWIARDLGADIFELQDVTAEKITEYDNLVFGAGLYASGIGGIRFITGNLDKFENMKIAVFATGATPPREEDIEKIKKANFEEWQLEKIRFFYLRGGFDYSKLSPVYKAIMTLFKIKLRLTAGVNPDAKAMLASYERPMDFTDERNIKPLVEYIQK